MAAIGSGRDVSIDAGDEVASVSTISRIKRVAFSLVAVGTLALAGVMLGGDLLMAFTGWVMDLGVHQVHDLILFTTLWIAVLIPMALLLYRPTDRVNTILAPVLFLVPLVVFAAVANSPILMLPAIFGVLALLALALHPAGRSLFHFDRVERVNRGLAAVMVVAAIPLLAFAGDQAVRQLTATDDHALFVHFGGMAIAATYVVVMGALAVTRERDWEFAAWSAGLVAVVIGAASILFPVESSVGPIWGTLAVLFGIGFVAAVEYVRRTGTATEPADSVSA